MACWWPQLGPSNCALTSIEVNAAPMIVASELAALTRTLPGPTAIAPIMARAGVTTSATVVADAVNAAPIEWLTRLAAREKASGAICPFHNAINRRVETNDTTSWVAGWAASSELASDLALSALDVAQQFYRERLLLLLVKE